MFGFLSLECGQVFDKVEGAARSDSGSLSPPLSRVEEAVSFLWATKLLAPVQPMNDDIGVVEF